MSEIPAIPTSKKKKNKLAMVAIGGGAILFYLAKKGGQQNAVSGGTLISPAAVVSSPDDSATASFWENRAATQDSIDVSNNDTKNAIALANNDAANASAASAQDAKQSASADAGSVPPATAPSAPAGGTDAPVPPPPMTAATVAIASLDSAQHPQTDRAFLASVGVPNPPASTVKPVSTSAPAPGQLTPQYAAPLAMMASPTAHPQAAQTPDKTISKSSVGSVKTRTVGGKKQWYYGGGWHTVAPH